MTNKGTKLSEEAKTEIKGIVQGAYDTIEIIPQTTQREQSFDEIVNTLKSGKFFVMREGYSRNSVYVLLRKLKKEAKIENVSFGLTRTGVYPKGTFNDKKVDISGKDILQFALFVSKA